MFNITKKYFENIIRDKKIIHLFISSFTMICPSGPTGPMVPAFFFITELVYKRLSSVEFL